MNPVVDALTTAAALGLLYFVVLVEAVVVWRFVRLSQAKPEWQRERLRAFEQWTSRIASRPALSVAVAAGVAWAGRLLLMPVLGIRAPLVTDEFAYLLLGDTFAHGRLANPTPPLWPHFEAIHEIMQPTYAGMHQPLQGAILALGQILGHPWIGVFLSCGLMCGVIVWALRGWMPARWAFLGGLIAAVHYGLLGYWMNSYWGGAGAAIGGALVVGALGRLLPGRKACAEDVSAALWMGLGMSILATTRAYEGAWLSAGAACLLAWRGGIRCRLLRVWLPMCAVVAITVAFLGFYSYRITGDPLRLPEMVQRHNYSMAGFFFWESPKPNPGYRNQAIEDFYRVWEMKSFMEVRSVPGFLWNRTRHFLSVWLFYIGPILSLPLAFLPRIVKDPPVRPLVIIGLLTLFGMSLNVWFYAHYAAPATALMLALTVQGIRHLRAWKRSSGAGLMLARAIPAMLVLMVGVRLATMPVFVFNPPDWPMTWYANSKGNTKRQAVLRQLSRLGGKHLAVVRYGPKHDAVMNEWVYNGADFDQTPVLWARELDETSNHELLRQFASRKAWLVEADSDPPKVTPYSGSGLH